MFLKKKKSNHEEFSKQMNVVRCINEDHLLNFLDPFSLRFFLYLIFLISSVFFSSWYFLYCLMSSVFLFSSVFLSSGLVCFWFSVCLLQTRTKSVEEEQDWFSVCLSSSNQNKICRRRARSLPCGLSRGMEKRDKGSIVCS